jgi:hypothetical protein
LETLQDDDGDATLAQPSSAAVGSATD